MLQKESIVRSLRSAGYILLLLSVFAIPLVMDGKSQNFFVLPKSFALMGLVLLCLLLVGIEAILNRGLAYTTTVFDVPLLVVLVIAGASSLFSVSKSASLLGRSDYFVPSFILLLALGVLVLLMVQHGGGRFRQLLNVFSAVGFISLLLFLLKTLAKVDVFGDSFPGVWNTIDNANTNFGVWAAVLLLIAAGQVLKKERSRVAGFGYASLAAASLVVLVLLGYPVLWVVSLGGLVVLAFVAILMRKAIRQVYLIALGVLIILIASFVVLGSPSKLQADLPLETSLGSRPSWSMVSTAVLSTSKQFAFGSGAGTFGQVFSRYRDPSFNYDKSASALRFNYPFSTILAMVSDFGIIFVLAFVFLIVYLLAHWYQTIRHTLRSVPENENDILSSILSGQGVDVALLGPAWIALTVGMGFLFYTFSLWWLWWFLLGLFMVGFGSFDPEFNRVRIFSFSGNAEKSATLSFVVFASGLVILIAFFVGARWFIAEHLFAEALAAEFPTAEQKLKRAAALHDGENVRVALAGLYMKEASRLSALPGTDPRAVGNYAEQAVLEMKSAVAINPRSVVLREGQAELYQKVAMLVPEAREKAIEALEAAKELEPSNAEIYKKLGDWYAPIWIKIGDGSTNEDCKIVSCDWQKAAENYRSAVVLRNDHGEALQALTDAYDRMKQPGKALDVYTEFVKGAPQDVPSLYNYGRLLYNRNSPGDRDAAEKIWLSVIEKEPNYSNALYSLGLINELRGDRTKALQYYLKVKELNPLKPDGSNADAVKAINAKITKLRGR